MINSTTRPMPAEFGEPIELNLSSSAQAMNKRTSKQPIAPSQIEAKIMNVPPRVDADSEVRRLIRAYSKKGLDTYLTNAQFMELVDDLMSTVDYPRLNQNETKAVFTAIDVNNDGTVSAEQIEEIIKNNKVK